MPKKKIRVVELFAGVGGFRLALEGIPKNGAPNKASSFETVWSNQWEPGKKVQHAFDCYVARFGNRKVRGKHRNSNEDIAVAKKDIPAHDLLVGGFPCQDYSVATTNAKGIHGKKGVLWWEIYDILKAKNPPYVLLENVDRLLKSPSKQRGRDFGVILWCLNDLGYVVEWRVLNAADYGFPQKRRRVFIFAAKKGTKWGKHMSRGLSKGANLLDFSFFMQPFPAERKNGKPTRKNRSAAQLSLPLDVEEFISTNEHIVTLPLDIEELSNQFVFNFQNFGMSLDRSVKSFALQPSDPIICPLMSVLESNHVRKRHVDRRYFIPKRDEAEWKRLKGAKAEERTTRDGFKYFYTEGALPFPDDLSKPGRTIMTGEGGLSPSRFKHIIEDPLDHEYRILTPVEVERMDGFPENWTEGMPERWRYFCMGNALVVGLIEKMGETLLTKI